MTEEEKAAKFRISKGLDNLYAIYEKSYDKTMKDFFWYPVYGSDSSPRPVTFQKKAEAETFLKNYSNPETHYYTEEEAKNIK